MDDKREVTKDLGSNIVLDLEKTIRKPRAPGARILLHDFEECAQMINETDCMSSQMLFRSICIAVF